MSEDRSSARSGRSWREISQEVTPRAMSRRGRRRRHMAWLRGIVLTVLLGASGWGLYTLVHTWESDRGAFASAVHSEKVRDITLLTNGVLPSEWVSRTLELPRQATLMTLDLAALRDRLMAHGQVSYAALTRSFPDTLVVTLQERTPVARLQVSDRGATRQLLVAKDGVVYDGINYDHALLASLPWLDGTTLRRADSGGYEPIAGMDRVADLLTTAQIQAPHLYREWLIVSLARLNAHGELVVRAQEIERIVFNARDDFFLQIARLDHVLDATRRETGEPRLESVNLGLGTQVPVRLARTPDEVAPPPRPREPRFNFQLSPPASRNRDL